MLQFRRIAARPLSFIPPSFPTIHSTPYSPRQSVTPCLGTLVKARTGDLETRRPPWQVQAIYDIPERRCCMKILSKALLMVLTLATSVWAQSHASTSGRDFSATPITQLGTSGQGISASFSSTYKGFQGGLYANGSNQIPAAHNADGLQFAGEVAPLNRSGKPSPTGKIVFTSIGMSNAADEFGGFAKQADSNSTVNHSALVIANGAKGGITACMWVQPYGAPPCSLHTENQYDRIRDTVLGPLNLTEEQVQVVWIKEANGGPGVVGCGTSRSLPCQPLCDAATAGCKNAPTTTEAMRYEQQLGEILRAAKVRWPNLKLAFVSTRIYAGYATVNLSPEPYAYEYGFSAKWAIQAQIRQISTGAIDSVAGDLNYNNGASPWVAWGPYLWADGPIPRSDGLAWCNGQTSNPCKGEIDFQADGTHPNGVGQRKAAGLLLNFFLSSPYSAWFRK